MNTTVLKATETLSSTNLKVCGEKKSGSIGFGISLRDFVEKELIVRQMNCLVNFAAH